MERKHFSLPTLSNKEPYLSLWWMENYDPTAFFMQVSEDIDHPIWLKFGELLEIIMRGELVNNTGIIESIEKAMRSGDYDVAIMHINNSIK